MMPDAGEGIKGCAARTGTPASALDPLARIRSLADMPFRPSGVRRRGASSLLCTTGDISNLRRQQRLDRQWWSAASKVVGSSVYNDKDEKIGSIGDLIIGNDKTLHAVIDVGGILGVGGKLVEVPFDKLQFGNVKGSSDNRIVMPGASKAALNAMPAFHYTNQG